MSKTPQSQIFLTRAKSEIFCWYYFNSLHDNRKRTAELAGNHTAINFFSNTIKPRIALYPLLEYVS